MEPVKAVDIMTVHTKPQRLIFATKTVPDCTHMQMYHRVMVYGLNVVFYLLHQIDIPPIP